jgi:hypothetical protein
MQRLQNMEAGALRNSRDNKNHRNQTNSKLAFWKPELFTDENRQAKFSVQYPDNVTGWQTYVLPWINRRMAQIL